jgi:hypothetical protein
LSFFSEERPLSILHANRKLLLKFTLPAYLFTALLISGHAQATKATSASYLDELGVVSASASTNDAGPAGIIPSVKGFNASIGTTSQHDAASGWSSLLTPNVAYRFNRYFSVDAGTPIYMYINVDANIGTKAKPVYGYRSEKGIVGDTTLAGHVDVAGRTMDYSGTVSLGMPSGNDAYGLGAGQVTYDINNHFEKTFGIFTPDIELGEGDTSSLVSRRVVKSYVSVGPMAHFQAGAAVDLPLNMSFEAEAYEQLPLKADLIYSTTGSGKKKVTTSTNVGPAEDNGFLTSLDIPLSPHVTMSGFYSRSLRDHDDVAGFSFTFLLRPPPRSPVTQ